MIIPLVRGLRKTLEQSDEDSDVHTMKSEMLESLQRILILVKLKKQIFW